MATERAGSWRGSPRCPTDADVQRLADIRAKWPHDEPFELVDGRCGVCGYEYADAAGCSTGGVS